MASGEIATLLSENPIVLWGGIILAALIFLITKHLENQEEEEMKAPRPSSLREIVRPKVKEHVDNRGKTPQAKTYFKIGRDVKGQVTKYVETKTPNELLDPNPNKEEQIGDEDEEEKEFTEEDLVSVRIIMIKPTGIMNRLREILMALMGQQNRGEGNEKFYIFREESFLNIPGDDMVVDDDVLSYTFAGMEVEIDDSTRNVVNQAVQTEVSESVLAALPNYTEKVDFLFPLHSQEITKTREEGEHLHGNDEGF